jgi:hypothetical protein
MVKRSTKKQTVHEPSELDTKVQQADPMIKQAISEYQKEIARLQKQLVKEQIAHESEKAHLLERIEQEKVNVVIQKFGKEGS